MPSSAVLYCVNGHALTKCDNRPPLPAVTEVEGNDCDICDECDVADPALFPCCGCDSICAECYRTHILHCGGLASFAACCPNPTCNAKIDIGVVLRAFRGHCARCSTLLNVDTAGDAGGGSRETSSEWFTCTTCNNYGECSQCFEKFGKMRAGIKDLASRYFSKVDVIDADTGISPATEATHNLSPQGDQHVGSSLTLVQLTQRSLASSCDYIHYECHGLMDTGWGCCYRALQMVLAHFFNDQRPEYTLPSITEIQRQLVSLPATFWEFPTKWTELTLSTTTCCCPAEGKIRSSTWMEPPDAAAFLRGIHGAKCDELTLHGVGRAQGGTTDRCSAGGSDSDSDSVDDLGGAQLLRLWRRLNEHFSSRGPKTPVIVDDVSFAYIIAGVAVGEIMPPPSRRGQPGEQLDAASASSPPPGKKSRHSAACRRSEQQDDAAGNTGSTVTGGSTCPATPYGSPAALKNAWLLLFDPHTPVQVRFSNDHLICMSTASFTERKRKMTLCRGGFAHQFSYQPYVFVVPRTRFLSMTSQLALQATKRM